MTQFSMTLGDFDFEAIFMVNPTIATLYFFSFIGLNVMVLLNMFIAIINDSYAEIQEETAEIQNELEIVDYVTEKITRGFNKTFQRGKVAPVQKITQEIKHKRKPNPKEKLTNVESDTHPELDLRVEKLEILLNTMENSIREDKKERRRFRLVPQEKRQDLFFRVLCLMESVLNDDDDDDDEEEEEEEGDNGEPQRYGPGEEDAKINNVAPNVDGSGTQAIE